MADEVRFLLQGGFLHGDSGTLEIDTAVPRTLRFDSADPEHFVEYELAGRIENGAYLYRYVEAT